MVGIPGELSGWSLAEGAGGNQRAAVGQRRAPCDVQPVRCEVGGGARIGGVWHLSLGFQVTLVRTSTRLVCNCNPTQQIQFYTRLLTSFLLLFVCCVLHSHRKKLHTRRGKLLCFDSPAELGPSTGPSPVNQSVSVFRALSLGGVNWGGILGRPEDPNVEGDGRRADYLYLNLDKKDEAHAFFGFASSVALHIFTVFPFPSLSFPFAFFLLLKRGVLGNLNRRNDTHLLTYLPFSALPYLPHPLRTTFCNVHPVTAILQGH